MNKFRMCSNIFNLGIIFVLLVLVSSIANASKYSAVVVDGNTREILFADGATKARVVGIAFGLHHLVKTGLKQSEQTSSWCLTIALA